MVEANINAKVSELGFVPNSNKIYFRYQPEYGNQDFKIGIETKTTGFIKGGLPSNVNFSPDGQHFAVKYKLPPQPGQLIGQTFHQTMIDGAVSPTYHKIFYKDDGVFNAREQNSFHFNADGTASYFAIRDSVLYRVNYKLGDELYGNAVKFAAGEGGQQVASSNEKSTTKAPGSAATQNPASQTTETKN